MHLAVEDIRVAVDLVSGDVKDCDASVLMVITADGVRV